MEWQPLQKEKNKAYLYQGCAIKLMASFTISLPRFTLGIKNCALWLLILCLKNYVSQSKLKLFVIWKVIFFQMLAPPRGTLLSF